MKITTLSPLFWILVIANTSGKGGTVDHKKCRLNIQKNFIQEPCEVFRRIDGRVPCGLPEPVSRNECGRQNCCYHENHCYRKPIKCYIDLRKELCTSLKTIQPGIYQGYSTNGSYCFVENIHSYFEGLSKLFARVLGPDGIKIYEEKNRDDFCVIPVLTNVTRLPNGTCTVQYKSSSSENIKTGRTWADQCIIDVDNHVTPFSFRPNDTNCACRLDSWLEKSTGEQLSVSQTIRTYVEEEENCSVYSQILGKLVRASWRERLQIVNSGEAVVVVDALLNLTDSQNKKLTTNDAEVMLDTSSQLSKYKFYERFENELPESLIQSTAKVMSNLIRHVSNQESSSSIHNEESNGISPRDINVPQALIDAQPTSDQSSTDVQWKILQNLERIAENMASLITIPHEKSKFLVNASEKSLDLQVVIVRSDDASQLLNVSHEPEGGTTRLSERIQLAYIPPFNSGKNENIAVISSFYKTPVTDNESRVSDILAVNLRSMKLGSVLYNLSWPVRFSLSSVNLHISENITVNSTTVCTFANETNRNTWKEYGCWKEHSDNGTTTCYCNHTTHFAVILKYTTPQLSETHRRNLEFLSISCGSIAIAALAAACLVFIAYRKILLKDRLLIHFNLIIALLGGYISFLFGSLFAEHQLNIPSVCFAATIASHFFFLATFFWFLVEGLYLFYKVVMVFSSSRAERLVKYSGIVGWMCPVFVVVFCAAISRSLPEIEGNYDRYYDKSTCFLQTRNRMSWALIGPVLAILIVNTCILCKVLIVIFRSTWTSTRTAKSTSDEKMRDCLQNSAKGAMILLPILGIPWIVGLFVNFQVNEDVYSSVATIGSYIYVIFMGMQGISVFLIYCFYNAEVRNAFRLSAERRKSVATIESEAKKRKRSKTPLLTYSDVGQSPRLSRSKVFSINNISPKLSEESTTSSSPSPSPSKLSSLPNATTIM